LQRGASEREPRGSGSLGFDRLRKRGREVPVGALRYREGLVSRVQRADLRAPRGEASRRLLPPAGGLPDPCLSLTKLPRGRPRDRQVPRPGYKVIGEVAPEIRTVG
jgi:hypothetical protein